MEVRRVYGEGKDGSIGHDEGLVLATLVRAWGPKVLEVGCQFGVSTRYLLQAGARVTSLDINPNSYKDPSPRHELVIGNSSDFCRPGNWDWAFVDGSHTYEQCKADILMCFSNAIRRFVFHDWNIPPSAEFGVQQAVKECFPGKNIQIVELDTLCGLAMIDLVGT